MTTIGEIRLEYHHSDHSTGIRKLHYRSREGGYTLIVLRTPYFEGLPLYIDVRIQTEDQWITPREDSQ